MAEHAEDMVIQNLIEALHRLRSDLDRVELWTVVLNEFQHPAPEYRADDEYLLPHRDAGNSDSKASNSQADLGLR